MTKRKPTPTEVTWGPAQEEIAKLARTLRTKLAYLPPEIRLSEDNTAALHALKIMLNIKLNRRIV